LGLTLPTNPHKVALEDMTFERQPTKPKPYENPKVEGWDTETDDEGYAFLLANSTGWKEIDSWDDVTSFLLNRNQREKRNFWWNLDFDVTALLKWDAEAWFMVTKKGFYRDDRGLKITYLPKKMLKIVRGKHTHTHYDILQFYNCSLAKAAKKYLGEEQHEAKRLRAHLWALVRDGELDVSVAGDYCKWDATKTLELAQRYLEGMHRVGLYPKHLISKGNLAEHALRVHGDVNTWRDVPYPVNRLAWNAYRGGWFDLWRKGTMDVWKYDIKSAYPSIQRQIPDLRCGEWVPEYVPSSLVGFVHCRLRANKKTPPMLASWYRANHLYPDFDEDVHVTLTNKEYGFLKHRATLDPLTAKSFIPNEDAGYPYRDVIDRFLLLKEQSKGDPPAYAASKEVVNSSYGKTLQVVRKLVEGTEDEYYHTAGKLFCPVAASTITGGTRVMVAEAIADHLDNTVMSATDSVTTTRPLKLDIGKNVGQWEVETYDVNGEPCALEGTFVKPGIYQIGEKETMNRGFKPFMVRLSGDKSYRTSLRSMLWRSKEDTFKVGWRSPVSSKMAMHRGDYSMANVWEPIEREIACNDARRLWEKPMKCRDLLEESIGSKPVPFSFMNLL